MNVQSDVLSYSTLPLPLPLLFPGGRPLPIGADGTGASPSRLSEGCPPLPGFPLALNPQRTRGIGA